MRTIDDVLNTIKDIQHQLVTMSEQVGKKPMKVSLKGKKEGKNRQIEAPVEEEKKALIKVKIKRKKNKIVRKWDDADWNLDNTPLR